MICRPRVREGGGLNGEGSSVSHFLVHSARQGPVLGQRQVHILEQEGCAGSRPHVGISAQQEVMQEVIYVWAGVFGNLVTLVLLLR